MQLSYFPDINKGVTVLPEDESKHLVRVLRKQEGDVFHIVDGVGGLYEVEVILAAPKKCEFKILKTHLAFNKRERFLHIAIAPTKNNDRLEWFLEKATEIGVDEITPILCDHSERKVVKHQRLQKVIVSAMKQSEQAYLPKLNPLVKLSDLILSSKVKNKLVAHCEDDEKLELKDQNFENETLLLIGPEGDFSSAEIALALNNEYKPVSLGKTRLRTETAGIFAVTVANL